jgi:hypothetical protein
MGLTEGMFRRFKALASERDDQLVMIDLGRHGKLYGYLRSAERDYFVLDQVRRQRSGHLEKGSRKTGNPMLIFGYDEITTEELPAPPAYSILGI